MSDLPPVPRGLADALARYFAQSTQLANQAVPLLRGRYHGVPLMELETLGSEIARAEEALMELRKEARAAYGRIREHYKAQTGVERDPAAA